MRWIRILILIPVFGLALLQQACSYLTDFVVVDRSSQPVEVRYKVKKHPGGFAPPVTPATIDISQLSAKGGQDWNPLVSTEYQIDEANWTVTVTLEPGKALRLSTMHHYTGPEDPIDRDSFPIEEISLTGANGATTLVGEQARVTFARESRVLYTLTYR